MTDVNPDDPGKNPRYTTGEYPAACYFMQVIFSLKNIIVLTALQGCNIVADMQTSLASDPVLLENESGVKSSRFNQMPGKL